MNRKTWALLAALAVTTAACATPNRPLEPLPALARATAAYNATCGEVVRLRHAGVSLPSARTNCITAGRALEMADSAYRAGRLAEATSGASSALVYVTAAQALLAATGAK
jgi:hypothetical protein